MADEAEAVFMSQLLQGLDDSFWSAVPSPDPSPIKQKKPLPPVVPDPCTRCVVESASVLEESSIDGRLLQGLDDSFWSAVPSPDPSPIKQKKPLPPVTPCTSSSKLVPDPCTRCVVESVLEESSIDCRRKVLSSLEIMYLRVALSIVIS